MSDQDNPQYPVHVFTTIDRATHAKLKQQAAANNLNMRDMYRLAIEFATKWGEFFLYVDGSIGFRQVDDR